MNLIDRCYKIEKLFNELMITSSKLGKEYAVNNFKNNNYELIEDLDYCFEVLYGKHKLGYTIICTKIDDNSSCNINKTIKELVEDLKKFRPTDEDIIKASTYIPVSCRYFISSLVNRKYKLGYSNKNNMITVLSPMLAKKYPEDIHEGTYYIQEKLDGNRCIAYYDFIDEKWKFSSRSGKPLNVDFDMSWADVDYIFDGEIMTLGKAGTRDFNRTSGAINGKYTDKSKLHYYIYDIVDENLTYEKRKEILDSYKDTEDCSILPVLDYVTVYVNTDYNYKLDEYLDMIVEKGGEGIMLRDPCQTYKCGKRTDALIKYKKLQTMDLRIVGWNEGKGKYEGAIGSFICRTDEGDIEVNVAGMSDDIRFSEPSQWINKIIEVAYFDISKSKDKDTYSLRFPRLKRIRDDKTTTSKY